MGNKLECNECSSHDKINGIQNLGLSSRHLEIPTTTKPEREFIYYPSSPKKYIEEKDKWLKIQATTTKIARPLEIEFIQRKSLFTSEMGFKLIFDNQKYDLKKFVHQNSRVSSLVLEIHIWNILSNVTEALFELDSLHFEHANISCESILLDNFGEWAVLTPNPQHVSLKRMSENLRHDLRFLVYSFTDEAHCTQLQKDFFSLAVTVIDAINCFSENDKRAFPDEQKLKAKFEFIDTYYSKELAGLLRLMTGLTLQKLPEPIEVQKIMNELRDLN